MNKLTVVISVLAAALIGAGGFLTFKKFAKGRPTVISESSAERTESMKAAFSPSAGGSGKNRVNTDPALAAELETFFVELGASFGSGDTERIERSFSLEAMFTYCDISGMIDWSGTPLLKRAQFRREFLDGMRKGIAKGFETDKFSDPKILRVEEIREGELVAYVKAHLDAVDASSKIRWWLLKTPEGKWQVYDFEELEGGLRLTSTLGLLIRPSGQMPPWATDFLPLTKAIKDQMTDSDDASERILESTKKLLTHRLPRNIEGFVLMMRADTMLINGDATAALALIERAEKCLPGSPGLSFRRGECHVENEDYPKAIKEYEKYVAVLGWDFEVHESVADCYFLMGEMEKSLDHARRGLAKHPQSVGCLASLALALPEEQVREQLAIRLKEFKDMEAAYEAVIDFAIYHEVLSVCTIAIAMLEEDLPDSYLIEYYEEEEAETEKDDGSAP